MPQNIDSASKYACGDTAKQVKYIEQERQGIGLYEGTLDPIAINFFFSHMPYWFAMVLSTPLLPY